MTLGVVRHHHGPVVGLGRVAGIGAERRVDGVGAGGDQHGVAVGLRLRHLARRDVAAGAAPVLDDDAVAPFLGEPLAEDARNRIGRPTRREGHDERTLWLG